ncbi:MAG: hypothetical protein HQM14_03430 [SAR324 cluster bacterium]|nr:hypothetical protein [SAR324 cluster bacterium]
MKVTQDFHRGSRRFIGRITCYVTGKATQKIIEKTSRFAKLLFEHSLASCNTNESIPVDCEDEGHSSCSDDSSQFQSQNTGKKGALIGAAGGVVLLSNMNKSDSDSNSYSPNKSLVTINQKAMRRDADTEGQVLLVERTNIWGL